MAGCIILPAPCETPRDDSPTVQEAKNRHIVQNFIERVWNHSWTQDDDKKHVEERARGNQPYVPDGIAVALRELRSPTSVRHRRDQDGRPIRSSGSDDYMTCVSAVHEVAQDLRVTILDVVADGRESVIAHLVLEGTDRRIDGRTDKQGANGRSSPSGQRFRQSVTTFYRLRNGMIHADRLLYGGEVVYLDPPTAAKP